MRGIRLAAIGVAALGAGTGAMAQEIVYTPVNPAFGGNPFNADYLLGTATPQRPDRPSTPGEGPLTEGEQFARQIQSRLLSALASSVVQAITGSAPGTSGEFTVGDQTIFFERTLTEIRLTITDNVTGETTTIVVPVLNLNPGQSGSALAQAPIAGGPPTPGAGATGQASQGSLLTPPPLTGPPIEGGDLVTTPLGGL